VWLCQLSIRYTTTLSDACRRRYEATLAIETFAGR
jgi:hypothetical protein